MNKPIPVYPAAGVMAPVTYRPGSRLAAAIRPAGDSAGSRQRWQKGTRIILGFFAGCAALPAMATDGAISAGSLMQAVLGLVLVLLVMAGSAWLLRRYGPAQRGQAGAVRLIGGTAVGQRERVVLLEVGDTWLVVGVAPGQVSALHSMPRGTHCVATDMPANPDGAATAFSSGDADAATDNAADRKGMNGHFSTWLNQLMEKSSGESRR